MLWMAVLLPPHGIIPPYELPPLSTPFSGQRGACAAGAGSAGRLCARPAAAAHTHTAAAHAHAAAARRQLDHTLGSRCARAAALAAALARRGADHVAALQ